MANKRQRKKAAKLAGLPLERQKARGGRSAGRKNLIYTDDGKIINQQGITFTVEEKKALESAVARATKKRREMLKAAATLPRTYGGEKLSGTVGDLQLMGKESDFIIAPKTKSLQRFKTREQYESYMANLERVNSRDYLSERTKLYKRNYIQAIRENYSWDEAKDVIMKIKTMPQDKYRELVSKDEVLEIRYLYGTKGSDNEDAMAEQLNEIRGALGIDPKDDY